ncbi:hypothetical protein RHECIAT_CH0000860 [Rhizobium etli CIAT 652]|uniref:Uncharacterized protein n=1 Tax=Rhizobium etli (strain CIAT 652) TaxID=491916 RepID=B3PQK1_RHIE6|nr:hypothetical protein RHECIAT_CH0000860 [Rhizobium etli CIAT 652]
MFSALAIKDFPGSKLQVRRRQAQQPKDLCGQRHQARLPVSPMQLKRVHRPLHQTQKAEFRKICQVVGNLASRSWRISLTFSQYPSRSTATLNW